MKSALLLAAVTGLWLPAVASADPEIYKRTMPATGYLRQFAQHDSQSQARDNANLDVIPESAVGTGARMALMASSEIQAKSWIQKTPAVCGGDACVRGTRHTVAGLVQWRRLGLSDARILEHHPDLTQTDLDAAWSYYQQHAEETDQVIREDEED